MTNCPGSTSGSPPETGASVTVHVSSVSRRRAATRNGTGVAAASPCCSASVAVAIDVEESEPCGLEALDDHLREPAHQAVAEHRVGVALSAQAGGVELRRAHVCERAGVEMP